MCRFLDRQREKGTRTKNADFQPDCLFLDQQGEKGTFELKTRVLDPKVTPFERFWALFGVPRDCLFPLPVEEKAISGLPGNAHDGLFLLPVEEKAIMGTWYALAIPLTCVHVNCSSCLSRKSNCSGFVEGQNWPHFGLGLLTGSPSWT